MICLGYSKRNGNNHKQQLAAFQALMSEACLILDWDIRSSDVIARVRHRTHPNGDKGDILAGTIDVSDP